MKKASTILRFLLFWVLLSIPALVHVPGAWADPVRILNYHSQIELFPDSTLTVTENIMIRCDGRNGKTRIFRDFPNDYLNRFGKKIRLEIKVLDVIQNDRSVPWEVRKVSNGIRVYLGEAGEKIEADDHSFTLTYKTGPQISFFEDFDELSWPITGRQWPVPIDRIEVVLKSPGNAEILGSDILVQPGVEKGEDVRTTVSRANEIGLATTRTLPPGSGATLVVSLAKGVFTTPGATEILERYYRDYPTATVGVIFLVLIWMYYLLVWLKVGIDPRPGTIVPQYEPPPGFSPAALRFVTHMGFDRKTFTSAIASLAVKGHLTIDAQNREEFVLRKERDDNSGLSAGERKVKNSLFKNLPSLTLAYKQQPDIQEAMDELKKGLQLEHEKNYFRSNKGYLTPGILGTLLAFLVTVVVSGNFFTAAFMTVWLSIWTIGVTVLSFVVLAKWRAAFTGQGSYVSAIGLTAFSLPFFAGEIGGTIALIYAISFPAAMVLLALIITNILFYQWLKAPTMEGRRLLDQVDGFTEYIRGGKKRMTSALYAPVQTPELFERFLPYAMALDLEKEWAEQFTDIFSADGRGRDYNPKWITGFDWSEQGPLGLATVMKTGLMGAVVSSSMGSSDDKR